jgi:hypothetical protein
MTTQAHRIAAREITADEISFFKSHGWAKFDRLISTTEAETLLSRLQEIMGVDAARAAHPAMPDNPQAAIPFFHTWEPLSADLATGDSIDDVFYNVSHSPEVGDLGQRLSGAPVRYWIDGALVKMPRSDATTGAGPTNWHTDVGAVDTSPFSPPEGQMQLWIALRDMTPEHGTMRFISPDKTTDEVRAICKEYASDPEASYPILEKLGVLSPPVSLKAGDATIHASGTLHSAPPNTSDTPRWGYFISLFPSTSVYSGNSHWALDQVEGLTPGGPFVEARFPVLA